LRIVGIIPEEVLQSERISMYDSSAISQFVQAILQRGETSLLGTLLVPLIQSFGKGKPCSARILYQEWVAKMDMV